MVQAHASHSDFYLGGPYAACVQEARVAGSAPARLLKVAKPRGCYPTPATPDLVLGLSGGGSAIELDFGRGRWRGRMSAGEVFVAPPHVAADVVCHDRHEAMLLAVPFSVFRATLGEDRPAFADFGRLHAAPFRDGFIERLLRMMWEEAGQGASRGGPLFADSALSTLAVALLRRAEQSSGEGATARLVASAPRRLRRTADYVEANLDGDLSISALAGVAAMSPFHFARAFREAFDASPHRYVMRRRLARAAELLAATRLQVTEIAMACGFASADHLATSFRRQHGLTPSEYRRRR